MKRELAVAPGEDSYKSTVDTPVSTHVVDGAGSVVN